MMQSRIEQEATAAGIACEYINARGQPEQVAPEIRQRLLATMSMVRPDAKAPLPACTVLIKKRKMLLNVAGEGSFSWLLETESGCEYHGEVKAGETITLPAALPLGYHHLQLTQAKQIWRCCVVIAPARCYQPATLSEGKKLWGACIQLYTLRSENNWGIGDFSDLQQMLLNVARYGGAFIGLNPLHSLYPACPENASPYSPSSRRWLNVLYIDVAAVVDFQQSKAAQRWWRQKTIQSKLAAARQSECVDYRLVSELKMQGLQHAWQHFCLRPAEDSVCQAFDAFIVRGGESLFWQGAYDALHAAMIADDPTRWGWPAWPERFQDTNSPQVQAFCQQNGQEIRFWLWLQWLADGQFAACWQASQQANMPIGLYRDLAVGVAEGGAETWCDRELYRLGASVGAPPDPLGPLGQNWGLPPMDPHILQARDYQPFIAMLRANMVNCGALRIDHVMSLLRLWWIPRGETADCGAYVYYPVDALLAILALESHRHQCMIIGEDLGTVPQEIVARLRRCGVYSSKVMYFEQQRDGRYRAPGDWAHQAIASASTHDLPTLKGFWTAGDVALGEALGIYADKTLRAALLTQRARQKQALLDALHRQGSLSTRHGKTATRVAMSFSLNLGLHRFLADSNSALLGLQPEDWIGMAQPVNVPGTTDSYPNWRRKLSLTLEEMFADAGVSRLLQTVDRHRRNDKKTVPR